MQVAPLGAFDPMFCCNMFCRNVLIYFDQESKVAREGGQLCEH